MKFNKNNIEVIILIISAFALMFTMLSLLTQNPLFQYDNIYVLSLAAILVVLTALIYLLLIIKRTNPKKYIYLSYSNKDRKIAEKISSTLGEQFKKLSKYHFEIISEDSIPFGNNIDTTIQENILKSNIVIIIVTPQYLQSEWCLKEFTAISKEDKRIIPIVTESFSDLAKLPNNISNIRALSLINCKSEDDFTKTISVLAKDLIKQRKD